MKGFDIANVFRSQLYRLITEKRGTHKERKSSAGNKKRYRGKRMFL